MKKMTSIGPCMTDEEFFTKHLNLNYAGIANVRNAVERQDYSAARSYYALYIRNNLKQDMFFTIPYEYAENKYTLQGETDTQAADRICENKLISCGELYDFGEKVNWYHNPTYNNYSEWTWQLSRHNEWKLLALVYRKTGNEKYAKCCADLFKSWVQQALWPGDVPGNETKCWRTIECGIRMGANWPYVLHAFVNSPAFTDDVLIDWYKSICEHGVRLRSRHRHGNWLVMEMNGLAHIGILCPEFAFANEWLSYAVNRLIQELDRQIYPDGFQYELSTGYHDVVINNYQRLIQVMKVYGVNIPECFISALENAALINIKLMMPDGMLPNTNDSKWDKAAKYLAPKTRILPERDDIKWVVSEGAEGAEPEYTSIALPYSGFLVMRESWKPDAVWALFEAAPFGRGHQHEDMLSLLIFAGGKLLLTEGGNYAYDDSEMRKYVLSTRSHNTIRVDGHDQNRREHYSWADEDIKKHSGIIYNINSEFDYGEGIYSEGYGPGSQISAEHRRSVYFFKHPPEGLHPFFIVVDRLKSDQKRFYEILWHVNSDSVKVSSGAAFADGIAIFNSIEDSGFAVIKGQKFPEWQGWVSLGGVQGAYQPVHTLKHMIDAVNCRVVTVLYPSFSENCPIIKTEASQEIKNTEAVIYLSQGRKIVFNETDYTEE